MMKGKQSQDDDLALAEAYLQHELMNEMKDYLDRGRRFERLTIPELNKTWIIAFRRFVAKDRTVIRELDDLAAELLFGIWSCRSIRFERRLCNCEMK